MAGRRPPRRRPKPTGPTDELEPLDGLTWPRLRANWEGRSEAEITAAHNRAKQLREHGWGAVDW